MKEEKIEVWMEEKKENFEKVKDERGLGTGEGEKGDEDGEVEKEMRKVEEEKEEKE